MSQNIRKNRLAVELMAAQSLLAILPDDDMHLLDRMGIQSRIRGLLAEADTLAMRVGSVSSERSAERTEIQDQPTHGTFLGVLLDSRRFEHKVSETGEVIRGKVAEDVDLRDLLKWVDRSCTAQLQVVSLARGAREIRRYVLSRLSDES